MKNLSELDLSSNQLNKIECSIETTTTSDLWSLYLNNNQLNDFKKINLRSLSKLEKLNLSDNKLTKVPDTAFENLVKLENLDLSNNPIESLESTSFQHLIKLRLLKANIMKLKQINRDFFNCVASFEKIAIDRNEINYLNLIGNENLNSISINNNKLTNLNN